MKKTVLKSKYEIKQLIKEDLIAYLYVGHTHYSNVPLYIWRYKAEYLNPKLIRKLIHQCDTLIQIKHPNLLAMLDYYYDGQYFYTVHEYEPNLQTLESYLEERKTWGLRKLWRFSTQILSFMLKLETKRLLCGQLNLNGICITQDHQVKCVKAVIPIEILKANWDQFNVVEDCIFYPPEFIQNQHYTLQSDIYSFGVLLYFFFSGKWPYKYTLKIQQLKREFLTKPFEFLSSSTRIPNHLGDIVRGCMDYDPQKRFQNFTQVIKTYKGKMTFDFEKDRQAPIQKELQESIQKESKDRVLKLVKVAALMIVTLIVIGSSYNFYLSYLTAIPEQVVPNVVGLSLEEAQKKLREHDLRSVLSGERVHPHIEKGSIIETKPPFGRRVKQTRRIRIFVSKGVGQIMVPDLIGRSQEQAQAVLLERGLDVIISDEIYSIQYPKGVVIAQRPTQNTLIGPSENIQVVLSKGFPVEMSVLNAKRSFFYKKDHLRQVLLTFSLLKEWVAQEVEIFFTYDSKREKIYSDYHIPGEDVSLEFELELSGRLDVFFNDEIGFSSTVEDMIDEPE